LRRGAIVTVAGDISESAVEARVRGLFKSLPEPQIASSRPIDNGGATVAHQEIELEEAGQAHWFGGSVTASRRDPDYWALGLVGVVLGAGGNLSGRITHRVRELEGLAYSCNVATVASAGRDAGSFTVAAGTSPERVGKLEVAVNEELAALVSGGVTEDELRHARAYVLGREPFARETARQWATLLAQAELFGVPVDDRGWVADRWLGVTTQEVLEAAQKHLDPRHLKVTVGSRVA
jgi:predicted Zn-dependent peptidase